MFSVSGPRLVIGGCAMRWLPSGAELMWRSPLPISPFWDRMAKDLEPNLRESNPGLRCPVFVILFQIWASCQQRIAWNLFGEEGQVVAFSDAHFLRSQGGVVAVIPGTQSRRATTPLFWTLWGDDVAQENSLGCVMWGYCATIGGPTHHHPLNINRRKFSEPPGSARISCDLVELQRCDGWLRADNALPYRGHLSPERCPVLFSVGIPYLWKF